MTSDPSGPPGPSILPPRRGASRHITLCSEKSDIRQAAPYASSSRLHSRACCLGEAVPYVCRITISGPEPDAEGVTQMMDAVASAIEAGWEAPRIFVGDDDDTGIPDESPDDDSPDGTVLDYRVLGYPGGAIILVVLDGDDLMQTSVAITGLAQHLTTWSPGLLEYSPDEVTISKADEACDGENWLPRIDDGDEEEDREQPRWHLAELLDDDLRELASAYLLARGIRSLWHPTDPVEGHRARDVVLGAVEDPWSRELTSALGVLLIRAARFEHRSDSSATLVIQGSGEPGLAADLLRRARTTGPEAQTDGWDDDEMRGHVLVQRFMEEHQLPWNQVLDDEAPEEYQERSDRQLKALLWAGLRALATMAMPLSRLSGPWQLLDQLGGDAFVSALAQEEEEQNQEDAEEDLAEVESAAAAHVLVWLAVRHPELLGGQAAGPLTDQVTQDTSALHHVTYEALLMAGAGPLKAALASFPPPPAVRAGIRDFTAAMEVTEAAGADEAADPYDDMHRALDKVLAQGAGLRMRIQWVLAVTGLAARLTETDANPRPDSEEDVSSSLTLDHYLLAMPAMHAAVVLHRHDDDNAVRTRMLSLAAEVAPAAAGGLASELPDLTGDDPRLEPAARARAANWVENAVRLAREHRREAAAEAEPRCGADARLLVQAVTAGRDLPVAWPVTRFVAASAEAASAILHSAAAAQFAEEVFADG